MPPVPVTDTTIMILLVEDPYNIIYTPSSFSTVTARAFSHHMVYCGDFGHFIPENVQGSTGTHLKG